MERSNLTIANQIHEDRGMAVANGVIAGALTIGLGILASMGLALITKCPHWAPIAVRTLSLGASIPLGYLAYRRAERALGQERAEKEHPAKKALTIATLLISSGLLALFVNQGMGAGLSSHQLGLLSAAIIGGGSTIGSLTYAAHRFPWMLGYNSRGYYPQNGDGSGDITYNMGEHGSFTVRHIPSIIPNLDDKSPCPYAASINNNDF